MKRFLLTLSSLALLGGGNAMAIVGGPFDNGDYSLLLERGGYYQAVYSFKNGNGYGIFTPDAQFFGGLASTGSGNSSGAAFFDGGTMYTDNSFRSNHSANRSVFYYKGITYVGSAFGEVDPDARQIQGICNATSDSDTSVSQANAAGSATSTLQNTSTIVQNNANFILNLTWQGKIYKTRPILRFRGKGEISVISPNGAATLAALAYRGFSGLVDAIVASVARSDPSNPYATNYYTQAQQAIEDALNALAPLLANGGSDATYASADRAKVRVYGSRRFF